MNNLLLSKNSFLQILEQTSRESYYTHFVITREYLKFIALGPRAPRSKNLLFHNKIQQAPV